MKKLFAFGLVGIFVLCSVFADGVLNGSVIAVERYGHTLLDITIEEATEAGFDLGDTVDVVFDNGYTLENIPYYDGYYVANGEPLLRAYPGDENIAVCINYGRIADIAGVGVGSGVTITLNEKEGVLDELEMNKLVYTNDINDYESIEVFANFREIAMGNIKEGRLYRSASPVNNAYNRASYADALIEKAGVNAVLNAADTDEDFEAYFANEDFSSDYYKSLYEKGNVIALGMAIDFSSDSFGEKLASGIERLSALDPPYLIHCTEGKDRAGFISALIECLMGASYQEIIDDFMASFYNYYGVTKDGDERKYNYIVENNIKAMLGVIAGGEDPATADLAASAYEYLVKYGMSESAVNILIDKLS